MKITTKNQFIEFRNELIRLMDSPSRLFSNINVTTLDKAKKLHDISKDDEDFVRLLKVNNIKF